MSYTCMRPGTDALCAPHLPCDAINGQVHETQNCHIGRHSPVSARLCLDPALLPCSKAPRSLPAAVLPEEAPAPSTAISRPAADDAACAACAAATGLRCSPVMPSASWAVGAVSTCSSVLLCSPPALRLDMSGCVGNSAYTILATLLGQHRYETGSSLGMVGCCWKKVHVNRQREGCVPKPQHAGA